jgi:hypothetical protein
LESKQILSHVDENDRARWSLMSSILQFDVMQSELWPLVCAGCCDFDFQKSTRSGSCEDRTSSLNAVCSRSPEKKGFGVSLERSMRIEHNGQWTEVPKECVTGVSFGVDGLSLSGDDAGLGIRLTGKSTDRDESVKVMIYKLRDKVSCFRVEPCSNVENHNREIQEWYRELELR